MPGTCEVCVSEPSKYRCPTCGLMSCSLACTQSHKIYCAPKELSPKPSTETDNNQQPPNEADGNAHGEGARNDFDLNSLGSSPQLKDLFDRYPSLRDELRDIYTATLEEEWIEAPTHAGRGRQFHRGRGAHRGRGQWTRDKGFNRGLGKVRKRRERCEEGLETGKNAEGFMRLIALINTENHQQESR